MADHSSSDRRPGTAHGAPPADDVAHRWVRVVRASLVSGDRFLPVDVEGERWLVTRLEGGRVVAFAAACPHQGQPMTFGEVEDGCIVCPHHRYAYDADTGANVAPGDATDTALAVAPAVERDGWVWVRR